MNRRDALREYAAGALWVLPTVAALVALLVGSALSQIDIGPASALAPIAFPGTADDARNLLVAITSTVVTVIALVLGLTVVALQLSSTQFSPRLLRNFLRDRPTQLVLSVFLGTFAYSTAGLYTVGVSSGSRVEQYPRLAVSGAIVLLFASLGMVVYFADHLAHSIQIDAITRRVERATIAVITDLEGGDSVTAPTPPAWAVPVLATRSGYVQTALPERVLPTASRYGVCVRLRPIVGEHVVAGTTLAWLWRPDPGDPAPDPALFHPALDAAVRIGFERTLEQDAGFGMRQLIDVACKALSPAVNDPYTAVQAVEHLSSVFARLSVRPLGARVIQDAGGHGSVILPGRGYGDFLAIMCGLIRRYGAREPTVAVALLRLLADNAAVVRADPDRLTAIEEQGALVLADAEREVVQPADLVQVRMAAETLRQLVASRRAAVSEHSTGAESGALLAKANVVRSEGLEPPTF